MSKTDKSQNVQSSVDWYIKNQQLYKLLGLKVDNILRELIEMEGIPYHAIFNRPKEIDSFSKKLSKKDYQSHEEVTDLAGIRVIVYVESQIEQISQIIEENFDIDPAHSHDKSEELGIDKVGYKSVHYVATLKDSRLQLPEYNRFTGKFFEIQVRTILQHAWAEIEHDRNYKFSGVLPRDIQRRFKLLAGTLESADREFNSISSEIDKIAKQVEEATKSGHLNIPINSTTLLQYMTTKYSTLVQFGLEPTFYDNKYEIERLEELEKFGVKTLAQLDAITPADYLEISIRTKDAKNNSYLGILLDLMVIANCKKYFSEIWPKVMWQDIYPSTISLYEHYNVPIKQIMQQYDIREM